MGVWLLAGAIGLVSGVLSGAFGIGGGIVTTPAIRWLLGAPSLIAVGTPLPVIVPAALTGARAYYREGKADVRSSVIMGVSGAATAVAGAVLATRVGGTAVLVGTGALIVWAAIDTLEQVLRPSRPLAADERGFHPHVLPLGAIGALAGLYSGFFGLGGGFVLVPLLTRWLRMELKRAVGTSLGTVTLLAVPGTITHALLGNIDWGIALGLGVGAVVGALVGARIALGAHERHVRIAFAVMLVLVGVALAVSELLGVGA